MCTIMTVSRELYEADAEAVHKRITQDSVYNNDGWAMVLLGKHQDQTVVMQTLDIDIVHAFLKTNNNWKRVFLHSRMATTSQTGIFGCHNFSTVGRGRDVTANTSHWLVQHNGVLRCNESYDYMVDSMLIADIISTNGISVTKQWLLTSESYANVFLINPDTSEYHVVRCTIGNLHTDGLGNFSSNPFGDVLDPVTEYTQWVFPDTYAVKPIPKAKPANFKASTGSSKALEQAIDFWRKDVALHTPIIEQEVDAWGHESLKIYNDDFEQFAKACNLLGYVNAYPMERAIHDTLTTTQKRWTKTLRIKVEPVRKTTVKKEA